MTGMWVAVIAEYNGATFSHRAEADTENYAIAGSRALHDYNMLLDEAGGCVRGGFAGWLPVQDPKTSELSTYEKLRAIEKIIDRASAEGEGWLEDIRAVLKR